MPDKKIKLLGISISSAPSLITCVKPYTRNGREYVGVTTAAGDYYTFDALKGRLIKDDIQYEKFEDLSQNNSKLFVNCSFFKDRINGEILIYAGSIDKNVYCIREKNFSTVWETETDNEIYSPVSLLDINGDSYPEVFGVNDYDNDLFVMDGKTGKKIITKAIKEGKQFNRTSVHLADLNGTGELNLIVQTNNESIKIFEMTSVQVPRNYIYSPEM